MTLTVLFETRLANRWSAVRDAVYMFRLRRRSVAFRDSIFVVKNIEFQPNKRHSLLPPASQQENLIECFGAQRYERSYFALAR